MKPLFYSDYQEGAHPFILEQIQNCNFEQNVGYGTDDYCSEAAEKIKECFKVPDADVHFLVGGTQTNATAISSILRPFQGALCASTAHIGVHETGIIEHGGHKVLPLPSKDGKITAKAIRDYVEDHFNGPSKEHTVQPGMVYISFPTELGTIYSKKELKAISEVCREKNLPLYVDGARLGYGLMSSECDIEPEEFAQMVDMFYVGGTKQGALFGEALVICNDKLKKDFRYCIKQNGGLLAKGWLLGIQFSALFTDNLYFHLSYHADYQADKIRACLAEKGYKLLSKSPSNQIFVVMDDVTLSRLEKSVGVEFWQKVDSNHSAIRICTSWATTDEAVDTLINCL